MKKSLTFILVLLVLLTVFSCGSSGAATKGSVSDEQKAKEKYQELLKRQEELKQDEDSQSK